MKELELVKNNLLRLNSLADFLENEIPRNGKGAAFVTTLGVALHAVHEMAQPLHYRRTAALLEHCASMLRAFYEDRPQDWEDLSEISLNMCIDDLKISSKETAE